LHTATFDALMRSGENHEDGRKKIRIDDWNYPPKT
jgi:hypothetical protein